MERDDAGAFALMTLIDRLTERYERCDVACAAQQGITAAQGRTLLALVPDARVNMNELSETMSLATSTTTRMVDQLVGKGLVLRIQDERDRRVVKVVLTDRGTEVRRALEQARQDLFQEVLAEIKRTERWTVLYALEKVASSVDKALRAFRADNAPKEEARRRDTQLRELRDRVRARNRDLSPEEADALANRFSREIIEDLAKEGKIDFEE